MVPIYSCTLQCVLLVLSVILLIHPFILIHSSQFNQFGSITDKTHAMARAFTINFPYNGSTYTAVITQTDGSITIYIPDETLHSILPLGKVSFDPQQGIQVDSPRLKPAQDLIVTILGVAEEKIKDVSQERKEFQ